MEASLTGGPLNLINGKEGISAPNRSVPVMQLVRKHAPKSKGELYDLIKLHYETKCSCGIVSKGIIEDFGRALYEAQKQHLGTYRFSLKECIQWEYDLFVTQSLKGDSMEKGPGTCSEISCRA